MIAWFGLERLVLMGNFFILQVSFLSADLDHFQCKQAMQNESAHSLKKTKCLLENDKKTKTKQTVREMLSKHKT